MTNGNYPPQEQGITAITVRGFKSLYDESRIEIRPLTILAGANSSGKSSIMQPLLLLKQTLEAPYDPGPLLLDGPNVRFTSTEQLLSTIPTMIPVENFTVGIEVDNRRSFKSTFQKRSKHDIDLVEMSYTSEQEAISLRSDTTQEEFVEMLSEEVLHDLDARVETEQLVQIGPWSVAGNRCFLDVLRPWRKDENTYMVQAYEVSQYFELPILAAIHVPGLRGNPERNYRTTATGPLFPGTFNNYVASLISQWQLSKDEHLDRLGKILASLGLTSEVSAERVDATQIELRVGRLAGPDRNIAQDMVSIADVGFGMSQILPVLVALLVARPGQLVYLEQPEIHLHPRAQSALARALAYAARLGVHVVAETHSSLLLLGIQTLVAEGKLDPKLVKLHWFKRDDETGITKITSADLDEQGAFGEWPEDFADVELSAEHDYLNASLFREVRR